MNALAAVNRAFGYTAARLKMWGNIAGTALLAESAAVHLSAWLGSRVGFDSDSLVFDFALSALGIFVSFVVAGVMVRMALQQVRGHAPRFDTSVRGLPLVQLLLLATGSAIGQLPLRWLLLRMLPDEQAFGLFVAVLQLTSIPFMLCIPLVVDGSRTAVRATSESSHLMWRHYFNVLLALVVCLAFVAIVTLVFVLLAELIVPMIIVLAVAVVIMAAIFWVPTYYLFVALIYEQLVGGMGLPATAAAPAETSAGEAATTTEP